ncbi:hypothetical protein B0T40_16180 [Chromobacterium haemolyticum]|nr:hypothetical protein B0T40_16180 [Chromobacterium haemolyticum]
MEEEFKSYLFEYRYNGERYGFQIKARSAEEAKQHLRCIASNASYDGEICLVIDVGNGSMLKRLLQFMRYVLGTPSK